MRLWVTIEVQANTNKPSDELDENYILNLVDSTGRRLIGWEECDECDEADSK